MLIVDDDPLLMRLGRAMLERLGYACVLASSGEEALRLLREDGVAPRWLLIDANLPGMSGLECARQVCAFRPGLGTLRVCGMSGDESDHMRQRWIEAGADAFVAKPLGLQALGATLGGAQPSSPR